MQLRQTFFLILTAASICALLQGQPPSDPCDPRISGKIEIENPYAYKLRGDRCEGIYIKDIASIGGLVLVSFTSTPQAPKVSGNKTIDLKWGALPDGPLHIRAFSLHPRVYYRMDTIQGAGRQGYTWTTSMLDRLELTLREVGIVAWKTSRASSTSGNIYVPLSIGPLNSAAAPSLRAIVQTQVELDEVFVTLARLGPDGRFEKPVKDSTPLRQGYYPAGGRIPIDIPRLAKSGTYALEVVSDIRGGGKGSMRWLFLSEE